MPDRGRIDVMKKTKKISPKNDTPKEFRHLGVMIESTNDNVKLIAEQFGDIKETLNEHTETLNMHTEMIGHLATDMTIIKDDIEFIKGSLKKKVDVDEFSALERRVSTLEKHTSRR